MYMTQELPNEATQALRALPCPNDCPSNLYHTGYQVRCQHCGLEGAETTEGATKATLLWNAAVATARGQ